MTLTKSLILNFIVILLIAACEKSPEKAFQEAKVTNTIEAYEDFLKKYHDSPLAEEAKKALEGLYLDKAVNSGSAENIIAFIKKFPESVWLANAKEQLEKIYGAEFEQAKKVNTISAYEAFINKYPESPHAEEAKTAIERLHLDKAVSSGLAENVLAFIKKFPNSKWISEAKKQLNNIIYDKEFQKAKTENTFKAYEAFINKYPDAPQTKLANELIIGKMLNNAVSLGARVIAIKSSDGLWLSEYWGIPMSNIKKIIGNQIIIESGSEVVYGSITGSPKPDDEEIGQMLIESLYSGQEIYDTAGGNILDRTINISFKKLSKDTQIEVKKIVASE